MRWWCALGLCAAVAGGCGSDEGAELDEAALVQADEVVGGRSYAGLPAVGALFVDGALRCTGTLISPRRVLTAAHCLVGARAARSSFRIGASAFAPSAIVGATRLRSHPAYDPEELTNDVAVVTLRASAPATPLPLLEAMDESWIGTELLFLGYGVTNGTTERGAGRKRGVWMPILELDDTRFAYAAPGKSTCRGDSGGPALYRDARGDFFVAGVTSWGDAACARFGVDTRVDAFLGFIDG